MSGVPTTLDTLPLFSPAPTPAVERFHAFLPWDLIYIVLTYFDFSCRGIRAIVPVADERALPPWSLSLERWYHIFHPKAWELLEADEDAETTWLLQAERAYHVLMQASKDPATAVECAARLAELQIAVRDVNRRRIVRQISLYGLRTLRREYIPPMRRLHPDMSESEAIAAAPLGPTDKFPPFSEGSVWPFNIPAPTRLKNKNDPPSPRHFPTTITRSTASPARLVAIRWLFPVPVAPFTIPTNDETTAKVAQAGLSTSIGCGQVAVLLPRSKTRATGIQGAKSSAVLRPVAVATEP